MRADYRLYLLDAADHIHVGESFTAPDDATAAQVAALVHDACSDEFPGVEVWQGTRRLPAFDGSPRWQGPGAEQINANLVQSVLEIEERLHRSFAAVRRSQKLVERTKAYCELFRDPRRPPPRTSASNGDGFPT
jgi:hypothetical protein